MYLINYDLCNPGQNYNSLISAIKAYGSWAHICESCWAVKTSKTVTQIRDDLKQYLDKNDKLFVCYFESWASAGLGSEVLKWLNS